MGNFCDVTRKKNTDIPILICNYKSGNEKQKNYCTKLINYIQNEKYIQKEIYSNNQFSILFYLNGMTHMIKNDKNLRDETIPLLASRIHNIFVQTYDGSFYPQKFDSQINYYSNQESKEKTEKLNKMKKRLLKKHELARNENNPEKKEINSKINEEIENMCIYGKIMEHQIKEEKKKYPERFIEIKDALQLEEKDKGLFALGLLANHLQENGTEVLIEKYDNNNKEEIDAGTACLQFISNGMGLKKKYDLHFDFGEKRNEELLKNKNEFEKFKENWKQKLSKDYNIPKDKIIVTFPESGSFSVQVIFQSNQLNNLDLDEFKKKFKNDPDFKELQNLKEIHTDVIMSGCKLSKNQLDSRGNRIDGWGINEERGNRPYNPPLGWIGIGLKVLDKYDNGNNTWIGMNNSDDEWCVAYHGVGRFQDSDMVKDITGKIYKGGFKAGKGQEHENCEDQYHPGNKVGEGVYCTPNIKTAEGYSGISKINGISYKTVLMVRVKPSAIRGCKDSIDYWVVNGTTDEIRPYRILYKEC